MFQTQFPKLILKGLLLMVFFLSFDVPFDDLLHGRTDGESSITLLPVEVEIHRAFALHDLGRTGFQVFDEVLQSDLAGQDAEYMDMIFDAVDDGGRTFMIVADGGEIGMQIGTNDLILQHGLAVLGAEGDMDQDSCQGLRHAFEVSPAPSGLDCCLIFMTQSCALGYAVSLLRS